MISVRRVKRIRAVQRGVDVSNEPWIPSVDEATHQDWLAMCVPDRWGNNSDWVYRATHMIMGKGG